MHTQPELLEDLTLAEASAWLVRLQDSARTPAIERAFKAWLATDAAHARAFAQVTDTWEILPGTALAQAAQRKAMRTRQHRSAYRGFAAAACLLIAIGAACTWFVLREPVYRTAIGEQRTLTLDDGTRVTLNTDTQLRVAYRRDERRIRLDHGEAMFEVAKHPERPFVVRVGEDQVRALGTTFVVRNLADRIAVALIEGKVEVRQNDAAGAGAVPVKVTVLTPGERITLHTQAEQVLDRPQAEAITAWRQGMAIFDNATLAEAAAEVNRYGTIHVHVEDAQLAQLRVSGAFTTHDPAEFARTIAKLHHLNVTRDNERIALTR